MRKSCISNAGFAHIYSNRQMQDRAPKCNADSLMMTISNSAEYVVAYTIYVMDMSELWAYAFERLVSVNT